MALQHDRWGTFTVVRARLVQEDGGHPDFYDVQVHWEDKWMPVDGHYLKGTYTLDYVFSHNMKLYAVMRSK